MSIFARSSTNTSATSLPELRSSQSPGIRLTSLITFSSQSSAVWRRTRILLSCPKRSANCRRMLVAFLCPDSPGWLVSYSCVHVAQAKAASFSCARVVASFRSRLTSFSYVHGAPPWMSIFVRTSTNTSATSWHELRSTDYVAKSIKRGRASNEDIIILPRTTSELALKTWSFSRWPYRSGLGFPMSTQLRLTLASFFLVHVALATAFR
jgi:hypothetical protein